MKEFWPLLRDSLFSVLVHLAPRFANVILFILMGRLLGPDNAGVLSLATTYLTVCVTITRGLDDLIVRQVARRPDLSKFYFSKFVFLRIGLSLALYSILLLTVIFIFDYPDDTIYPILILCLSILPDSITYMVQAVFLGQRKFGIPTVITTGSSLLKLLVGYILVIQSESVLYIAWLWPVISCVTTLTILIVFLKRRIFSENTESFIRVKVPADNRTTVLLFILITVILALESQSDTIFLSAFATIAEVGWYGAATTITFSLTMFSQAYRMAVYPVMTRYASDSPEKLVGIYERSLYYLGGIVFPIVGGLMVLAPKIVVVLFDVDFLPTVNILRVLSLTLIFVFFNVATSRMMLVQDKQGWSLVFLTASFVLNVTLNVLLDPRIGVLGAAIARVSSLCFYFLLNYVYVNRFLCATRIITRLYKPVIATIIMSVIVGMVYSWPLLGAIGVGVISYGVVFYLIGGPLPEDVILIRQGVSRVSNFIPLHRRGA